MVTVAPGTIAPVVSVTVPTTAAVSCCALATLAFNIARSAISMTPILHPIRSFTECSFVSRSMHALKAALPLHSEIRPSAFERFTYEIPHTPGRSCACPAFLAITPAASPKPCTTHNLLCRSTPNEFPQILVYLGCTQWKLPDSPCFRFANMRPHIRTGSKQ